jgi:hypothetical protein
LASARATHAVRLTMGPRAPPSRCCLFDLNAGGWAQERRDGTSADEATAATTGLSWRLLMTALTLKLAPRSLGGGEAGRPLR